MWEFFPQLSHVYLKATYWRMLLFLLLLQFQRMAYWPKVYFPQCLSKIIFLQGKTANNFRSSSLSLFSLSIHRARAHCMEWQKKIWRKWNPESAMSLSGPRGIRAVWMLRQIKYFYDSRGASRRGSTVKQIVCHTFFHFTSLSSLNFNFPYIDKGGAQGICKQCAFISIRYCISGFHRSFRECPVL